MCQSAMTEPNGVAKMCLKLTIIFILQLAARPGRAAFLLS